MKRTAVQLELETIAKKNRGILRPEDVVSKAKSKDSVLHNCFEWRQGKAAHEYRLWQARKLITSYRIKILETDKKPSRFFVSLKRDRYQEYGGYRQLKVVLSQPNLRQQFLNEAIEEWKYFEEKYRHLKELAKVFQEFEKVRKKQKKVRKN